MNTSENNQAILLLTAYFSSSKGAAFSPLTATEYGRFSKYLHSEKYKPEDLFSRFDEIVDKWQDPKNKITSQRLKFLLGRGGAMGMALEKWQGAGIWIISRADREYPDVLKKKLKIDAPAILFGVGNKQLLTAGGVAIVGSRNINEEDAAYAKKIAESAASEGMNVVSGGAKGVDMTAMQTALAVEGTALGILASDLLKSAVSGLWRPFLKRGDLCLVSPYYPEAGFNVGNAMGRNKYIYCLADFGVVVRSDEGKGGTWTGAKEALSKRFVPVFVNPHSDAAGNKALIEMGAQPLECSANALPAGWLNAAFVGEKTETEAPLSEGAVEELAERELGTEPESEVEEERDEAVLRESKSSPPIAETPEKNAETVSDDPDLFYHLFAQQIQAILLTCETITLKELKVRYQDLTAKQLTQWLSRAVDEKVIVRQGKAHQYLLSNAPGVQHDFLSAADDQGT